MPVPVTTIEAVPRVTDVFWNSMFDRSPTATSAVGQRRGVLGDRRALAGERRLLRLERRRAEDATVGRHDVAGLHLYEVAGHDVDGRDLEQLTAPEHPGEGNLHLGQRIHAGPGGQLLAGPQHDVQHDEQAHDDGRRHLIDDQADDGDAHQHEVHRVAELLERHRPDRRRLLTGDLVRPVPGEPLGGVGGRQAGPLVRPQLRHDLGRRAGVRRCDGHSPL